MTDKVCGTISLITDSQVQLVEIVHYLADRFFGLAGFDSDEICRMISAVREAVNNAIKHGNQMDPNNKVALHMTLEEDRLLVRVKDEGKGFDIRSVPSPLDEENILKDGGRGIFFMRKFMDSVEFNQLSEEGMEVILTKYLPKQAGGSK